MAIIGYARVSTLDQDLSGQIVVSTLDLDQDLSCQIEALKASGATTIYDGYPTDPNHPFNRAG